MEICEAVCMTVREMEETAEGMTLIIKAFVAYYRAPIPSSFCKHCLIHYTHSCSSVGKAKVLPALDCVPSSVHVHPGHWIRQGNFEEAVNLYLNIV